MTSLRFSVGLAVFSCIASALIAMTGSLPALIAAPLALPGILISPGYVLTVVVFERAFPAGIRLVLALAASVALLVATSLLTAAMPIGLTAFGVTSVNAVLVILFAASFVRGSRDRGYDDRRHAFKLTGVSTRGAVLLLAAIVVAAGAVVYARLGAQAVSKRQAATELYFVSAGSRDKPDVVVQNLRATRSTFVLVLRDARFSNYAGHRLTLTLAADGSKRISVSALRRRSYIRVALYRVSSSHVYRFITLSLQHQPW